MKKLLALALIAGFGFFTACNSEGGEGKSEDTHSEEVEKTFDEHAADMEEEVEEAAEEAEEVMDTLKAETEEAMDEMTEDDGHEGH